MAKIQKITPFLWFDTQAEEAALFYVSIFKNSKLKHVVRANGRAMVVQFILEGQEFSALNGGPQFRFTEAVSFMVSCKNQKEVDFFWEKLIADGGSEGQCGWLKDKFGMSWQIVPEALPKLMADPKKGPIAMTALMQMKKIVIKDLSKLPKKVYITVNTTINAPIEKAWTAFTQPKHVTKWNHASDDWHTPKATNDLRVGGRFVYTMAAKDGSFSFDFSGTHSNIEEHRIVATTLDDQRTMVTQFDTKGKKTLVTQTFEAENQNPVEMQRGGWQAILDNLKKYVEESLSQ